VTKVGGMFHHEMVMSYKDGRISLGIECKITGMITRLLVSVTIDSYVEDLAFEESMDRIARMCTEVRTELEKGA